MSNIIWSAAGATEASYRIFVAKGFMYGIIYQKNTDNDKYLLSLFYNI